MQTFMFVYLGGDYPADPEQARKHFAAYQQWLVGLGDAVISPAVPIRDTHVVHPDRNTEQGNITRMSGLSIINFPSMSAALEVARSCPFLDIGGTLEVSEVMDTPPNILG